MADGMRHAVSSGMAANSRTSAHHDALLTTLRGLQRGDDWRLPIVDFRSPPLYRLTGMSETGLAHRKDVKKEGRTDYVHENTDTDDRMSGYKPRFCTGNAPAKR
jgi:hypothetical protein